MDFITNKSWMLLPRKSPEYIDEIIKFVNKVLENANGRRYFPCPCTHCCNSRQAVDGGTMFQHLSNNGMWSDYKVWSTHGLEEPVEPIIFLNRSRYLEQRLSSSSSSVPFMEMVEDSFPFYGGHDNSNEPDFRDWVDDDYKKYERLVEEARAPLYPGCKVTILSAVLRAMKLKVENGMTDKSIDEMCKYICTLLPDGHKYPVDWKNIRRVCEDIGLGYHEIHACEFNCVLFYKMYVNEEVCPIFHTSRWKRSSADSRYKVPRKVVKYFPVTPRLKRLFMSKDIAKHMRWHGERVREEEWLRHPADGEAWQEFDRLYPHFSCDVRNVRLGLATDGFNPFKKNDTNHSTWPVILIPYNLPPSMCMKKEFNIMSLLISGQKSPGKCLSVLMEPLIDELLQLWHTGVLTSDRHSQSMFTLKATVMWTISDFPGLGMLAGSTTKGYKACPQCLDELSASYEGGRMVYDGHHRWLPPEHSYRIRGNEFDGKSEFRPRPRLLTGQEILSKIDRCMFPTLSLHPHFKINSSMKNKLCWTNSS